MKIRKGDSVVVIAGKNKNSLGKIVKVLPKQNRVIVEGVNKVTKHVRKSKDKPGQKVQFEAPIHASNVMLVDETSKKRTRKRSAAAKPKKTNTTK